MTDFLAQWTQVTGELAHVVAMALDVEPVGGLDAPWSAVLRTYGVTPLGEDERLAEVAREKQTKGAPLSEVAQCLAVLEARARVSLGPVTASLSAPQRAVVAKSLDELAGHARAHYREQATARKKGMFGAAKALAAKHQYGSGQGGGYVLTCSTCRAPRLGDVLTCAFCGGALEATT